MQGHKLTQFNASRFLPRSRTGRFVVAFALAGLLALLSSQFLARQMQPFAGKAVATFLVIGADKPEHGHSRSDTMLLVRVQLEPERRISVLSLPRDTRIQIPGRSGQHRLNSAFAFGGAPLLRQTVESNFGVHPDYTLTLHTEGMESLVDALGGVDVDVPQEMRYDDNYANLHIHLKPGLQRLNGKQAVHFVRFRKDGHGDLGRIQRQQQFIKIVAKQAFTPARLAQWKQLVPALHNAVETDLSDNQMMALAYRLRGLQSSDLHSVTLPGHAEYISGASYFVADADQVAPLLTGSKVEAKAASLFQMQGNGWLVLNGSGRNGYARRAAHQLQAHGQKVNKCANAPKGLYPTSRLYTGSGADGQRLQSEVQATLGMAVTVETDDNLPKGSQVVILGDDYRPAPGY